MYPETLLKSQCLPFLQAGGAGAIAGGSGPRGWGQRARGLARPECGPAAQPPDAVLGEVGGHLPSQLGFYLFIYLLFSPFQNLKHFVEFHTVTKQHPSNLNLLLIHIFNQLS